MATVQSISASSALQPAKQSDNVAELMERVLIGGDLSKLSTPERLQYYKAVCDSVKLNPLTKPFEYITLNGKLTLYARKDCTDQLRALHSISVTEQQDRLVEGIYVVTTYVKDASGRTDVATGAVPIENLKGEARANAMMKAETKSKRRATLSICGLGMLDETEVETIPTATRPVQDEPPRRLESPRQTVEALSERITKVEGGYDCDEDGEVHAIRKDEQGIFCSCGSRGSEAQCIHRLALKLWTARQAAAAPAPEVEAEPEPEVDDVEAEVVDPQEPLPSQKTALSKPQFIALCELTRELEAAGYDEEHWRAKMERISGFRSRKRLTEEHLARVIFAFNKDLEAAARKGRKK